MKLGLRVRKRSRLCNANLISASIMKEMIENRKDRGIIKSDFKIKGDHTGSIFSITFSYPDPSLGSREESRYENVL